MGIAAIAQGRRHSAAIQRHLADDIIQFLRGNARLHHRRQRIEDFGGQPASAAHPLKAFRPMELDRAVTQDGLGSGYYLILGHRRAI